VNGERHVSGEDFVAENGNWKVEIGKKRRPDVAWKDRPGTIEPLSL
jgi:hypothetical protein